MCHNLIYCPNNLQMFFCTSNCFYALIIISFNVLYLKDNSIVANNMFGFYFLNRNL